MMMMVIAGIMIIVFFIYSGSKVLGADSNESTLNNSLNQF